MIFAILPGAPAKSISIPELMNEPFAGDVFADPLLMEPERADLTNLQPFYDILAPAIRSADPDRIVFFEPVTWSGLLAQGLWDISSLPVGRLFRF